MSENNDDFEKLFTEIVSSDDLKDIQKNYENNVKMGTKELLLIQQSLADASSNIAEIMLSSLNGEDFVFGEDNIYHNLLSSLYKISEDFNECMIEFYLEDMEDDEDDEFDDE